MFNNNLLSQINLSTKERKIHLECLRITLKCDVVLQLFRYLTIHYSKLKKRYFRYCQVCDVYLTHILRVFFLPNIMTNIDTAASVM